MAEEAKKLPPTPEQTAAPGGNKIGLERTMLLNLQKLKESSSTVMKAEDLEYPDLPSNDSQSDKGRTREEINEPTLQNSIQPETAILPIPPDFEDESDGLPDIDALSLDDDIDISDVTKPLEATDSSSEDDILASGFELDDESFAQDKTTSYQENSDDIGEEGDNVGEVTTKRDLVRLKRKLALEEKKKQRELEMKKQEAERKKREEFEKSNNILSIDELKRKADEAKGKTIDGAGSYEDMFGESKTASGPTTSIAAKQLPTSKPTLVPLAVKQQTYSTPSSGPSHDISQGGAIQGGIPMKPYTIGPPRKWHEALGLSIGSIVAEILKIATPALLVGFFLLQQQDTNTSQKAINHILSGNQFEMELGLSLLKTHFTSEQNLHYYELVKMKVERDIEEVWKVEAFPEYARWGKLREFGNYSFVDESLNLPIMVKDKMEMHQKKVRELYDRFYETELKDNQSKTFVDILRQANIFLTTGECVKSYDKFGAVQMMLPDSYASLYGKVLSFNCAVMKDPQNSMDHFRKQMALVELEKMRQRVAQMNKTEAESTGPSRAPASNINPSYIKKGKR